MPKTIDQLIFNSPYEEPREHWRYHRGTRLFTREPERRKAGYVRASESPRSFDDPGIFIELRLRNWPWGPPFFVAPASCRLSPNPLPAGSLRYATLLSQPPRLCLRSVISRTTGQIARAFFRG